MAGRIPKSFIDELLTRVDIVDVIDTRVPLKKAGKDYKACCPFHDEKTPSFTVSPNKQFYHCFGCGAHGSAISFLMDYEHLSFPEAVEDLAQRVGLPIPRELAEASGKDEARPDLYGVLSEAAQFYRAQLRDHPGAKAAVDYLKGRGVTGEVAKRFELGFAPPGWDNLSRALGANETARENLVAAGLAVRKDAGGHYDRFRNRIMFPIHDSRGRIVGFGGRVLGGEQGADGPKYLNSPETALFHKGQELYGLYRAREAIKRANRVLVVEGYMDVVALDQFGIDYAVATLGTATTRDHLERLWRFVPEIVCCFDGDRAGRDAAWRALEVALALMRDGRELSFLFLPDGEDPDSLIRKEGAEAFARRAAGARPLPDFFFEALAAQVDLKRLDGRARLVELARPMLGKLPSGVFRQMMVERLAQISQVSGGSLATLIASSAEGRPVPSGQNRAVTGTPKEPPSVVRMAIALLVQHPQLATGLAEAYPEVREWDMPGATLLAELLDFIAERPAVNTAAIVEGFRGGENEAAIGKLSVFMHPILEQDDLMAEIRGLLEQMRRAHAQSRAESLLAKERAMGLEPREKAELARLLAEKHRVEPASTRR